MWSAEGNRASNTLTGADGLYNGRSVSRQNQPPITNLIEIWRGCVSAVVGPPLNWAILRFLVQGIGWRDCAAFSNAGLFTIRNGARVERWRARGELKTVRPGAATRERFLEGEGEKAFWCHGGEPISFGRDLNSAKFAACIMTRPVPSIRGCPEKDVCDLNN